MMRIRRSTFGVVFAGAWVSVAIGLYFAGIAMGGEGGRMPSASSIENELTSIAARVKTSEGQTKEWTERFYNPRDLWAYLPRMDVSPPSAEGLQKAKHPIDAFIDRALEARRITAAGSADRPTLIRRICFDLTGLPPTPQEVEAFAADDSEDAYERLIERLMSRPRYGQRMAQHWLDVVRYADTDGFSNDFERPHAWRYRDYVIRAFNSDKPYDRFVVEQIAGDELNGDDPEMLIATGFLRMGPWEHTAMSVAAITRQLWLDDVTNSVGVTFLAHELQCARCHDHKFDPIPTRDYYAIQAVFASTRFEDRPAPFLKEEATDDFQEASARIERLKKRKTLKGLTENAGDALTRIVKKRNLYLDRALKRYQPVAYSVRSAKIEPTHILTGGSLESPGEPVEPGVMSVVRWEEDAAELPSSAAGRRLALARWIADPQNTLTARVMVNRVWQMHFGRGIVATANTFGKMGAKPTHPELLDFLANWFIEHGWSIKKLHRLILTSRAYQRDGRHPEMRRVSEVDPTNELLSYFPARRLTAEELRDAMLAVSGELTEARGGPGVFARMNQEVALQPRHIMGGIAPAHLPSAKRAERNRRTIFTFRYRGLSDPMMEVFNRPGTDNTCEMRDETTVTPQVFALFNGQFAHDRALALAARVNKAHKALPEQIDMLFGLLYGRAPTAEERARCLRHVTEMIRHHETHKPKVVERPRVIRREMIGEQSGELFVWEESLEIEGYEPDLKPWDVDAPTRALAELCLVLLNSSAFLYVY